MTRIARRDRRRRTRSSALFATVATRHLSAALLAVALTLGIPACGAANEQEPLLILAASDLQLVFEELVPAWEEHSSERVRVVLGSTGNLATQIRHGAPADLFLAANEAFLDELIEAGRIRPETRRPYAVGRLALIVPPGRELPEGLEALSDPAFRIITIANPDHAPYGIAAREALLSTGHWEELRGRLALGENIAQSWQFVQTGNADAGLVALGLVVGGAGKDLPHRLISDTLHAPLRQSGGVPVESVRPDDALRFLAFLVEGPGREILARYGFEDPAGAER